MKRQIELKIHVTANLSDILKEVTFTYDLWQPCADPIQEGVELFGADESIGRIHGIRETGKQENGPFPYYLAGGRGRMWMQRFPMALPDGDAEWYRSSYKSDFDGARLILPSDALQNIHGESLERERLEQRSKRDGLTGIYNSRQQKWKSPGCWTVIQPPCPGCHRLRRFYGNQ